MEKRTEVEREPKNRQKKNENGESQRIDGRQMENYEVKKQMEKMRG